VQLTHAGMQGFRCDTIDRNILRHGYTERTHFGNRKEGPGGVITWEAAHGATMTARQPVWLEGLGIGATALEDDDAIRKSNEEEKEEEQG
jgi:hypothetical protein